MTFRGLLKSGKEVVPRPNQQVATMDSRLRAFPRMNLPTYYGSKVEEDPQEFIYEVYKIFFIGLSTSEKAELDTY